MTAHRYVTARRLDRLHGLATPADLDVLRTLRKLRVASGLQIQALHHGDGDDAKQRRIRQLRRLSRLQLIGRMDRRIGGLGGGSVSTIYTLDVAGLRLIDDSAHARRPWQPSTPFVRHSLACTQVFVDLVLAERRGHLDLINFDAEPRCWRDYRNRRGEPLSIKPDADVTIGVGEFEWHWWVEVDLGTESRPRIAAKAAQYVEYLQTGDAQRERGVSPLVGFLVPDDPRRFVVLDALKRTSRERPSTFVVDTLDHAVDMLRGQAGEVAR